MVAMVYRAATVKTVPQELTANRVFLEKLAYRASREHQENLANQVHLALQDNLANQENRAPLALQAQRPHRLKRL
jgi:hypothetical protein